MNAKIKEYTLDDVCYCESSNIAQKDLEGNEGNYPIFGASGLIKNVDFYKQDKEYIAVVKDGAGIGKVFILPKNSSIIGTLQYILPKDNTDIKYLYYAMVFMNLSKYFSGSTIPHIYFKTYKKEKINLPTIDIQVKRASILSEIDEIINKYEQLIEKHEILIKSRFVEMFHKKQSIKSVNLEEVCSSIVRGPFGSALKKDIFVDKDEQSIKIYEQKHAIRKDCNIGSYYISKDTFEELKRFKCGPGDILMSCSGTIGELYQLPEEAEVGIINQALCKFTPKKEINSEYFLAEMNHIIGHVGTQGSSIKNIVAVSQIKKLQFLLPTDKRQTEYACFVKQVNKSKFAIQKSIEKLEILKKSLMQEYFG